MNHFYENLVHGESAVRAMISSPRVKWMQNNGFSKWRQWAPFVLIGDDVSFDFGKPK